jgi:hypothetical protein
LVQDLGHRQFPYLEPGRPKIDENTMLYSGRSQVSKHLRHVLTGSGPGSFHFHNQLFLDDEVGEILANDRAILIVNRERPLLLDLETEFPQPMDKSVLVNFFQVATTMVTVDGVASFTNDIRKLEGAIFHGTPFARSMNE